MDNIGDKANSTAGSTGELTAEEYNDHKNELQGAVESSGQTLSISLTPDQLSRALFIYGTGAASLVDSGSGDTISLEPLTGASGLTVPDTYPVLNGSIFRFTKTTENTSTSVTANLSNLGAKSVVRPDGSVPSIGDVIGECFIYWDNANDQWVLLRNGSGTFKEDITATGTITPVFDKTQYTSDTSLGDNIVTVDDGTQVGQKIKIISDGTGYTEVTYTGKLSTGNNVISDGLSLDLEWDGVKWIANNVVTADYVSGGIIVLKYPSGIKSEQISHSAVMSSSVSNFYGSSSGTTYFNDTSVLFSESFLAKPHITSSPTSANCTSLISFNITTSQFNVRLLGSISTGTTGTADILAEGEY